MPLKRPFKARVLGISVLTHTLTGLTACQRGLGFTTTRAKPAEGVLRALRYYAANTLPLISRLTIGVNPYPTTTTRLLRVNYFDNYYCLIQVEGLTYVVLVLAVAALLDGGLRVLRGYPVTHMLTAACQREKRF